MGVTPTVRRSTYAAVPPILVLLAAFPLFAGPSGRRDAAPAAPSSSGREQSYDEALRLYRAGRFRDALEVIARVTAAGGSSVALHALAGWCHLRGGDLRQAESEFEAALVLDQGAIDPRVGLGYVNLRRGSPAQAAGRFQAVLRRDPRNLDALKGLGLAERDRKRYGEAAAAFRSVLAIAPQDGEAAAFLDQVLAASGDVREIRPRPAVPASQPIRVVARAADGRLEVAMAPGAAPGGDATAGAADRLRPFFVKGINLGVALPGRFPAEFPEDQSTYATLLEAAADLGANTVRLYTLLPPAFYAALAAHNRGSSRRLRLLQGVWTELPDDHDYDAPAFLGGFEDEIRRVIDAVHGNLDLPARPGHASGAYRADVSDSVLGILLGREWEPYSVEAYDARRPAAGRGVFRGTYFTADPAAGATPFEIWLARVMDFTVGYETDRYRRQRPVSFVNWPTLDPLTHPTEPTVEEEKALLRRIGERVEAERIVEYDNDAVGVDATHIRPTAADGGGSFATYHAYPYYPDFMNLDPGYLRAKDSHGPSNYIGYLRDLARHHGSQPIVIAEFGVPSSRGIAHLQPQGFNHGGHSETAQGEIDARLMGDIREAGLAGGVLFALVDEWFKRNWLVLDFEVPYERNPLWLNALDPEQNYGLVAARPGKDAWRIRIDGRDDDWKDVPLLAAKPAAASGPERSFRDGHDPARTLRSLAVTSDEAYVYVRLQVDNLDADGDGSPDWDDAAYLIGIDTYDTLKGDHRMPLQERVDSPAGLEFCLIFDGPATSRLLVDPPYDIQTHRYSRPYQSVRNDDGRFMEMRVETNRTRVGRDGTVYPAQGYSHSPLRQGSIDRRDPDFDTLADWKASVAESFIEARIAWGLLNVTDPSSRRVLQDNPNDLRTVGTVETPGFRFYALAVKPRGAPGGATPIDARLADRLPAGGPRRPEDLPRYVWRGWDRPSWWLQRKASFEIVRRAFAALPDGPMAP
jgi:tetratricopeptide (TPR) repeat protein